MKVTVGDIRVVGAKKDLIRFSVSFCDENAVPHFTTRGWLFDSSGAVKPPVVYTGKNRFPSKILVASEALQDHLRKALMGSQKLHDMVEGVLEVGRREALEREAIAASGVDLGEVEVS